MPAVNDFVLCVGTVNGSGSQSSNNLLVKSLFRMGLPVCGKNLFPSNIAGLPTWFSIRVSSQGYMGRKSPNDIVIAMNADTFAQDMNSLSEGGVFIYNSDLKVSDIELRQDTINLSIPCRTLIKEVTDSIKLKKLLTNMLYVGFVSRLLNLEFSYLEQVAKDMFASKASVIESNLLALKAGWNYAEEQHGELDFPFALEPIPDGNKDNILIDGNSAGAAGLVFGGCTFMSWYPITPSSSLAEGFANYSNKWRKDESGNMQAAVVQAEDELSAISMVLGAGWAGSRAATTTSGPGVSLMAEAAGLSYFAEIPAVIWDVQRVGPSTGLPTRTMQGDVTAAYNLSHGDCKHVVLFPSTPDECFSMGQTSLDLAEELQTLVIVLSDLDLGMNFWSTKKWEYPTENFQRGKVLNQKDLDNLSGPFQRYKDKDDDGVCYRTLPGTKSDKAAYFTRGTGHDDNAIYSEDNENYRKLLDRLSKKFSTARKKVPAPIIDANEKAKVGIIAFGTTDAAIDEVRDTIKNESNIETSYLRLRALPLSQKVQDFVRQHDTVFLVEQNRDAQMKDILLNDFPELHTKVKSILQYDGLPLESKYVIDKIVGGLNG